MTPSQPVAGNQLSRTSAAEPLTVAKRSIANPPRPSAVINTTPNAVITLFRMDMFENENIIGSLAANPRQVNQAGGKVNAFILSNGVNFRRRGITGIALKQFNRCSCRRAAMQEAL